jgi:hypothetical protein
VASHSGGRPSFCGRFGLVEFSSLTLARQSMKSVNEQVRSEKEDVVKGGKKRGSEPMVDATFSSTWPAILAGSFEKAGESSA